MYIYIYMCMYNMYVRMYAYVVIESGPGALIIEVVDSVPSSPITPNHHRHQQIYFYKALDTIASYRQARPGTSTPKTKTVHLKRVNSKDSSPKRSRKPCTP